MPPFVTSSLTCLSLHPFCHFLLDPPIPPSLLSLSLEPSVPLSAPLLIPYTSLSFHLLTRVFSCSYVCVFVCSVSILYLLCHPSIPPFTLSIFSVSPFSAYFSFANMFPFFNSLFASFLWLSSFQLCSRHLLCHRLALYRFSNQQSVILGANPRPTTPTCPPIAMLRKHCVMYACL